MASWMQTQGARAEGGADRRQRARPAGPTARRPRRTCTSSTPRARSSTPARSTTSARANPADVKTREELRARRADRGAGRQAGDDAPARRPTAAASSTDADDVATGLGAAPTRAAIPASDAVSPAAARCGRPRLQMGGSMTRSRPGLRSSSPSWLISLSPGAGVISCMAAGMRFGYRRALWNILGLQLGIAAGDGDRRGRARARSSRRRPSPFAAIKWLGAAYLVWLGVAAVARAGVRRRRARRRQRRPRRYAARAGAARLSRQCDESEGHRVHARGAAAVHRSGASRSCRSTRSAPRRSSSPIWS